MARKATAASHPIRFERLLRDAPGPGAKLLSELVGVPEDAPVPTWHVHEIADRLENDAEGGEEWDALRDRVFPELKKRR